MAAELDLDLRLPRTRPHPHSPGTPGCKRCSWPRDQTYVSDQDLTLPCCMVSTPDRAHFGNVFEHGMDAIWNDLEFAAFRAHLDSDEPPALCRSCAVDTGTC